MEVGMLSLNILERKVASEKCLGKKMVPCLYCNRKEIEGLVSQSVLTGQGKSGKKPKWTAMNKLIG